ncbi:MAG: hypothetical protein WAL98_17590 [Desulfatiglandaceae bacterium]|jgi:hypothetical protein
MMKLFAIAVVLTLLTAASPAFAAVLAKGEGIVVTSDDMAAMRKLAPAFFTPTKKALLDATIRTMLFAKEADVQEVPCEDAYGKEGFDYTFALSHCYLRERLVQVGVMPGAVESYYRVHQREFIGADGSPKPLDETLERRIRIKILKAKVPIFRLQEYERLAKKYKVKVCGPGGC